VPLYQTWSRPANLPIDDDRLEGRKGQFREVRSLIGQLPPSQEVIGLRVHEPASSRRISVGRQDEANLAVPVGISGCIEGPQHIAIHPLVGREGEHAAHGRERQVAH
jgi:hypothetical protein